MTTNLVDFRQVCPSPPATEQNVFSQASTHEQINADMRKYYLHTQFRQASGLTQHLLDQTDGFICDIGGFGHEFSDTDRPVITVDIENHALANSQADVRIGFDMQNIPCSLQNTGEPLVASLQLYHRRLGALLDKAGVNNRHYLRIQSIQKHVSQLIALLTATGDGEVGLYMLSQICINLPPDVSSKVLSTCLSTIKPGGTVAIMDKALCVRQHMASIRSGNCPGFDLARELVSDDPQFSIDEFMLAPVLPTEEFATFQQELDEDLGATFQRIIDRVKYGELSTQRLTVEEVANQEYRQSDAGIVLVRLGQHAMCIRKQQ